VGLMMMGAVALVLLFAAPAHPWSLVAPTVWLGFGGSGVAPILALTAWAAMLIGCRSAHYRDRAVAGPIIGTVGAGLFLTSLFVPLRTGLGETTLPLVLVYEVFGRVGVLYGLGMVILTGGAVAAAVLCVVSLFRSPGLGARRSADWAFGVLVVSGAVGVVAMRVLGPLEAVLRGGPPLDSWLTGVAYLIKALCLSLGLFLLFPLGVIELIVVLAGPRAKTARFPVEASPFPARPGATPWDEPIPVGLPGAASFAPKAVPVADPAPFPAAAPDPELAHNPIPAPEADADIVLLPESPASQAPPQATPVPVATAPTPLPAAGPQAVLLKAAPVLDPDPAPTAAPEPEHQPDGDPQRSAAERFEELKTLLDRGLITQEEHDSKRREIISHL